MNSYILNWVSFFQANPYNYAMASVFGGKEKSERFVCAPLLSPAPPFTFTLFKCLLGGQDWGKQYWGEKCFFTLPCCFYWIPCKVRWGTGLYSPCFVSALTNMPGSEYSHWSKSVGLWFLKHCLLKQTVSISCRVPFRFLLQTLTLQSQRYKWKQFKN